MFRRCVLAFFLMGCFGATLQAAPMFGETMEFRQPDGTEVPVGGNAAYEEVELEVGSDILSGKDTLFIRGTIEP